MTGSDKRREVVEKIRVRADEVMRGTRDTIELSHLDATRLVTLFDELIEDNASLKTRVESNWQRSVVFEKHIARLGSTKDAAFEAEAEEASEPSE